MSGITDRIVQSAVASVLQGSADAFVTAQIATGISTGSRFGWMIDSVEFLLKETVVGAPQTSDCDLEMQLTQGTAPAAIIASSSTDLICERRLALPGIAAAVNAYVIELGWKWKAPDNYLVVDPLLNVVLDSTSTAVTNTLVCRIFYFPVQLQELDILRLIALR